MKYEMKLPDAVLTFKLLDSANMTGDGCKLALKWWITSAIPFSS